MCHEQYVGQTNNKLSVGWSSHRNNWNKHNCKTDNDHMVLSRHYSNVEKLRHVEFIIKQTDDIQKPQGIFCSKALGDGSRKPSVL